MAAARYLRLWRCWRPGGLAPLGPARRRLYAACSFPSPSPWALWAPRGPAPAPLAGLGPGPRRHLGSLGGGNGLEGGGAEDGGGGEADPGGAPPAMTALTPLLIPEHFPDVPLIAVTRNPVFPRFIKILEVKNKKLVELLRRKVRLAQPYAGVFLKKDDKSIKVLIPPPLSPVVSCADHYRTVFHRTLFTTISEHGTLLQELPPGQLRTSTHQCVIRVHCPQLLTLHQEHPSL